MQIFKSYQLGQLELKNRVVMAPMTRSRAIGNVANELMRDYYASRASAGLLITEGIAPSANALGYSRIPGLFNQEQVESFRPVTDAVHGSDGRIFAQLMHVGRIAHDLNLPPGARIVAPSAVTAQGAMWTDQRGEQPFPEPQAMSQRDLREAKEEFVRAARYAIDAGFDGVELHAANGYLLNQFLHPHTNRRTDSYGGSPEARARFVVEVVEATVLAIGADRVGIRLSPHGTFNDLPASDQEQEQYRVLARGLRQLAYVHVINNSHADFSNTLAAIRQSYGGTLIRNGGFTVQTAEQALSTGEADLISFGRPFIANPDFVKRAQTGAALNSPDPDTFYTPGPHGYVDYPML